MDNNNYLLKVGNRGHNITSSFNILNILRHDDGEIIKCSVCEYNFAYYFCLYCYHVFCKFHSKGHRLKKLKDCDSHQMKLITGDYHPKHDNELFNFFIHIINTFFIYGKLCIRIRMIGGIDHSSKSVFF